jgi:hypothetical protein
MPWLAVKVDPVVEAPEQQLPVDELLPLRQEQQRRVIEWDHLLLRGVPVELAVALDEPLRASITDRLLSSWT